MKDFLVFARDENARVVYKTTVITNLETVEAIRDGKAAFLDDEEKQPPSIWGWHAILK